MRDRKIPRGQAAGPAIEKKLGKKKNSLTNTQNPPPPPSSGCIHCVTSHHNAQVIKNVSTLFFDQPELLHGKDGLEFFVPKNCSPPKPSQWFEWSVQTHNRFGRTSFRVAVRMLLLCEKRSRNQPPDLTKKKVRLDNGDGSGDSSDYSSSEEESSDEDDEDAPKDPGHVDPEKLPPIWDHRTERVFSEFEKMTLQIKPMTDDQCWEDSLAQKEENDRNADAVARGKRSKPDSDSPPDSPPPPSGAPQRSRKSARIIAKVNRGATYQSYKHLSSGRGMGMGRGGDGGVRGKPGRMSLTKGLTRGVAELSTISPDLAPLEGVELKLVRDPKEMSLIQRPGLHQLPPKCMERIIFFLAQAEGKEELKAQREALMKSLGKHR